MIIIHANKKLYAKLPLDEQSRGQALQSSTSSLSSRYSNGAVKYAQNLNAATNVVVAYCYGDGVFEDLSQCSSRAKKADANGADVEKLWEEFELWKYSD